jgi:hypothetical protein
VWSEGDYFERDLDCNTIGYLVCFSQPLAGYFLIRPYTSSIAVAVGTSSSEYQSYDGRISSLRINS